MNTIPADAEQAPSAPIFVVGCERSGTTLLRLMLTAHPRIALPPQTKYLRYLYKRRLWVGNLQKRRNRDRLADWLSRNLGRRFMIEDLEIDHDGLLERLRQARTFGDAMALPWRMYAAGWDKPRWGDKRPYYIRYLRGLFSLFPDARVIHIIRDPRDVITSLRRVPWWERGLSRSIANWKDCIRRGNAAVDDYPGRIHQLRYEDLVADAEGNLRTICDFVGESFHPAMLDQSEVADRAVPGWKKNWHENTFRPVNASAIGRWRDELSAEDADLITWATREQLVALGYEETERPRPGLVARARYRIVEAAHRTRRCGFDTFDAISRLLYSGPMAYTETQSRLGADNTEPGSVSRAS